MTEIMAYERTRVISWLVAYLFSILVCTPSIYWAFTTAMILKTEQKIISAVWFFGAVGAALIVVFSGRRVVQACNYLRKK